MARLNGADAAAIRAQQAYRSIIQQGGTDKQAMTIAGQEAVRGGGLGEAASQGYIKMGEGNKYTGGK